MSVSRQSHSTQRCFDRWGRFQEGWAETLLDPECVDTYDGSPLAL